MEHLSFHSLAIRDVKFDIAIGNEYNDPISQEIVGRTYSFPAAFELLFTLMRPGQVVLDLGAHIGTFTLAAAALGCRVIAIEASTYNAELLKASVIRNRFNNVQVVTAAVSDHTGTVEFVQQGPFGIVCPPNETGAGEVRSVTVASLMNELCLDKIDFIKLDVEGSEVAAIRGMSELLNREDAPAILYECNGLTLWRLGETVHHLIASLENHGYKNYLLDSRQLIPVKSADFQPAFNVDHLAVKKLPGDLHGWQISPPMTAQDILDKVVLSCTSSDFFTRLYIAKALIDADYSISGAPKVIQALCSLCNDPEEEVRVAVSWFDPGRNEQVQRLQLLLTQADVILRRYEVVSRIPVLGGLVAWIRKNLTSHLREPYIDPILEQQVAFNRNLLIENIEMAKRQEELLQQLRHLETQLQHIESLVKMDKNEADSHQTSSL